MIPDSPDSLLDALNAVEKKHNCNSLIKGIDMWPVVRNFILSESRSFSNKKKAKSVNLNDLKNFFISFFRFLIIYIKKSKINKLIFIEDKFIVSSFGDEYCTLGRKKFDELSKKKRYSTYIFNTSLPKNELSKNEISLYFLMIFSSLAAKFISNLRPIKAIDQYLERIDKILSTDYEKYDSLRVDYQHQLKKNIYYIYVFSFFMEAVLKRLQTKYLYIFCYYSPLGMSLCTAANKIGIKSIDVQHGIAGRNMRAYGRWVNIGKAGVTTLPNYFFCWTPYDRRSVEEWACKTEKHKAVMTGNLVNRFFKNNFSFQAPLDFKNLTNRYKNIVLYSSSGRELSEEFLGFIKKHVRDSLFLIRLHPDQRDNNLLLIDEKVKKISVNTDVVFASSLPLEIVLGVASIHVTEWSAVVYDAFEKKVPTVITSQQGKEYFFDLLEENIVRYVDDIKDIGLFNSGT